MQVRRPIRNRRSEKGIALLIAIFVLLLIGVLGIALIVSSGSETALAGNYRASTNVYYAAVAGLEEVRSRLRNNTPNSFNSTNPNFLPPSGTPLAVCSPRYVINPLAGEAVVPWDQTNPYFDNEFSQEFPVDCGGAPPPSPSPTASSVWNTGPLSGLGFPGPMYKWVRINGVSERSLNLDTYPNFDGLSSNLIYYDSANHLTDQASGNQQVLEVTALAVLPTGDQNHPTRKLVQYLIAPLVVNLPTFPAGLTLLNGPSHIVFSASPDMSVNVRGIDQDSVGSCNPGGAIPAIGVLRNSPDIGDVINGWPAGGGTGIPGPAQSHYTGTTVPPGPPPAVQNVGGTFAANLQTPAGLQTLVQSIVQNADVIINGSVTGSSLPSSMNTPTPNPMTIVVNGNLDLRNWNQTGYGLLLVTGTLTYDTGTSWRGIILVIGQGIVSGVGGGAGQGDFDGAVLVANTSGGGPNLGTVNMNYQADLGGEGIHFSSCWVKAATPAGNIKILSFHEIAQ